MAGRQRASSTVPLDDSATIGRTLHATRRRRRISMARAATETRIRRDYLEAMERGDFSFQAPVYAKGFLTNYARFLRIDPTPLVLSLEEIYGSERNEALVLAEQNAAWTDTVRMPSFFRPIVITTCALLLLTMFTLWTKASERREGRRADRFEAPVDAGHVPTRLKDTDR